MCDTYEQSKEYECKKNINTCSLGRLKCPKICFIFDLDQFVIEQIKAVIKFESKTDPVSYPNSSITPGNLGVVDSENLYQT